MRLTLIVPHLFAFAEAYPLPKALQRLQRAQREGLSGRSLEEHLCRLYGLNTLPIAALTHALDTGSTRANKNLLRADPVHLSVQQNSMLVIPSQQLELQEQEVQALLTSLNSLLKEEQLELQAPHPERWYLQTHSADQTQFLSLPQALGRPLPPQTIFGDKAKLWKRRLSEIQMTLHEHPVNEAREARGLMPINHLWIWGGDTLDNPPQAPAAQLWGDHAVLNALAKLSQSETQAPAATFKRWLEKADHNKDHIIVLDTLSDAAHAGDVNSWIQELAKLTEQWLEPAFSVGLDEVVIEAIETENACRYTLGRWHPWQFWKKTHVGY